MGYGNLRGPGDFTPEDPDERIDERAEELEREIPKDAKRLAEIDRDASELLAGEQYERLFSVMADAEDSGLVAKLAEGEPLTSLPQAQLDVFARLVRLAKEIAAEREKAVREAALAQAERESEGWPLWRGSAAMTLHYAQMRGPGDE